MWMYSKAKKPLWTNNIRRSGKQHALAYFHLLRVQGNTKAEGERQMSIGNYKNVDPSIDLSEDSFIIRVLWLPAGQEW